MKFSRGVLAFVILSSFSIPAYAQSSFKRADSNADGELNIADGIHELSFLFSGGAAPPCRDAADANDDGAMDISDGLWILSFLFVGGPPPKAPFPGCGLDPTGDDLLDCQSYSPCNQNQMPTFPHPDPDPCGQIEGPCESAVIGPYTMVSTPEGDGVLTTATPVEGEIFLLRWDRTGDNAVNLTLSMPGSSSLEPFRFEAGLPTLQGANLLAGITLLLNTPPIAGGNAAAPRKDSENTAGCDPNKYMHMLDCTPLGHCCDLHDACIWEECTDERNDSGDVRTCALRDLHYLDCLLGPNPELCEALPRCSTRCSTCHLGVVACFMLSIEFPLFAPGPSDCCERGDCGDRQQCIMNGVVQTKVSQCPYGNGSYWGDVHLVTFDHLMYDFQGVGEYIMSRSSTDELEVQVRTAPWGSSRHVSVTKATAMNVAGDRVAFYLDRSPSLYVNGTPTALEALPLQLPGGGQVRRSGGALVVEWPDSTQVQLVSRGAYLNLNYRLAGNRRSMMDGLLGDFDGARENDLTTRSGRVLGIPTSFRELYGEFGESWRIPQEESLFDYFDGATTETYTDRTFPAGVVNAAGLPPATRSAAELTCAAAGVTDPALLEACILDVGSTGEASFAEAAAEVAPPEGSVELPPCTRASVTWVDWTTANTTQVSGAAAGVTVTFTGAPSPPPILTGAFNYWSYGATSYSKPGLVDNPPGFGDLIALAGGPATGVQTVTFSPPVVDPVMTIFSLGRPGVIAKFDFETPFELLNTGPGYYGGAGIITKSDGEVLSGAEGNGLLQFHGLISSISWTAPIFESWVGIQIGLTGCQ